jgi:hypothetical protein
VNDQGRNDADIWGMRDGVHWAANGDLEHNDEQINHL